MLLIRTPIWVQSLLGTQNQPTLQTLSGLGVAPMPVQEPSPASKVTSGAGPLLRHACTVGWTRRALGALWFCS